MAIQLYYKVNQYPEIFLSKVSGRVYTDMLPIMHSEEFAVVHMDNVTMGFSRMGCFQGKANITIAGRDIDEAERAQLRLEQLAKLKLELIIV